MRTAMQPAKILANWSLNAGRLNQQFTPGNRQLVRVLCSQTLAGKLVAEQQNITRQLNALSSSVTTMNKLLQALPDSADPCVLPTCPPGWTITTTTLAGQRLGIVGINLVTECGLRPVSQSPVPGTDCPDQSVLTEDDSRSEIVSYGRVIRVPDFSRDPGFDGFGRGQWIHRGSDHTFLASDETELTPWTKESETNHMSFYGGVTFNRTSDHALSTDREGAFKISGFYSDGKWVVKGMTCLSYSLGSRFISGFGERCLTFGGDRDEKIWALDSAGVRPVQADINSSDSITEALTDAWGKTALICSHDGMVKVFSNDYKGSWYEQGVILHGHDIGSVTFNMQKDHFLICGEDNIARIWGQDEHGSWYEKAVVCHTKKLNGAIFSDRGDLAITYSEDGTAVIVGCDGHGRWKEQGLIEHNSPIVSVIIDQSQKCILTVCSRGTVKTWARQFR